MTSDEHAPPRPADGGDLSHSLSPFAARHDVTATRASVAPVRRRRVWIVIAALTCPCHIPIVAAMGSGTALGALLSDNIGVAAVSLGGLFLGSLLLAIRRD